MEEFKIANFMKEHSNVAFPSFRTLPKDEARLLVRRVAAKFCHTDKPPFEDPHKLNQQILASSKLITFLSKSESKHAFEENFKTLGINPSSVMLAWGLCEVDCVAFKDLIEYFDYIWYPGPDEMWIFDDFVSWLVIVTHYGDLHQGIPRE